MTHKGFLIPVYGCLQTIPCIAPAIYTFQVDLMQSFITSLFLSMLKLKL
jgi:hypothetical protein